MHFTLRKFKKKLVTYKCRNLQERLPKRTTHLNSADNFIRLFSGACMVAMTDQFGSSRQRGCGCRCITSRTPVKREIWSTQHLQSDAKRRIAFTTRRRNSYATHMLGSNLWCTEFLRSISNYKRASREETRIRCMERFELSMGYLSIGGIIKVEVTKRKRRPVPAILGTCHLFCASLSHATLAYYLIDMTASNTYPFAGLSKRVCNSSESLEITWKGDVRAVRQLYSGLIDTIQERRGKESIAGYFQGCTQLHFVITWAAIAAYTSSHGLVRELEVDLHCDRLTSLRGSDSVGASLYASTMHALCEDQPLSSPTQFI
jgi:hypothetical protein